MEQPVPIADAREGEEFGSEAEEAYSGLFAQTSDIESIEVDVREQPFTVFELHRKVRQQQILVAPDYQRNDVWDDERRSRFIESVMLNIPLPALYLNQKADGTYVVVDGRQRITSLVRFLDDQYALHELTALPWLEGKRFSQLEPKLRARIEDRKLNGYILKSTVPMRVVYEIFDRVNTGGVPLSRMEVRNGLQQGAGTRLLEDLAASDSFLQVTGGAIRTDRMRDRELVLRCLAFAPATAPERYKADLDDFLTTRLRELNRLGDVERRELSERTAGTLASIHRKLGSDVFRFPTTKTGGRPNFALAESVFRVFWHHGEELELVPDGDMRDRWEELVLDPDFRRAVTYATGDRRRLLLRLERAEHWLRGPVC